MKLKFLHALLLLALTMSALTPQTLAGAAPGEPPLAGPISPQGFLNPDGTLRLQEGLRGTLDLAGYGVTIDPSRGPVFGPPAAVTPGDWAALGDGGGVLDASVAAIAVVGTDVYIGGNFTDAANIPEADYIVKWDGASWSALGGNGAGDGSLGSEVNAIVPGPTGVYVSGYFVDVKNNGSTLTAADRIAHWDGSNWSALGSNGAGNGSLNNYVTKMAGSGSNLYVSGMFTDINNGGTVLTAADYIAKWDGTNWSALGSNGAGDGSFASGNYIGALAVSGTDVYVGGSFTNVNNGGSVLGAADRVAKWDGTNWSALGSDGAGGGSITSGWIYSLAVSGTDVYVGGNFMNLNNGGTVLGAADFIAKWDGANWSALGSNGAGNGSLNSYPVSLLVDGTNLYVGGTFINVNNNGTSLGAADYLAKWNGTDWSALGSNGAGNGAIPQKSYPIVNALAMQAGSLLAGGTFYDLNDGGTVLPQADFLGRWNGTNWSTLDTDANGALVNGYSGSQVYAVAVMGSDIFVGGYFSNVSNHGVNIPEADFIAKWDGTDWSALGSDGNGDGSLSYTVRALAVMGSDLYAGGQFSNVNNNGTSLGAADYVAKWDGTNWSALGNNGAGNGAIPGGSYIGDLAVSDGQLYVGGTFTDVNNGGIVLGAADNIAKWDGVNWSALGDNGAGDGALNGYVTALAVDGAGNILAGGGFTDAANQSAADYIASWDGANWSALGSNGAGDGSLNNGVDAIATDGTNIVYAGGFFSNVNNHGTVLGAADLVARWDGANWSALGGNGSGDGIFCLYCGNAVRAIFVNGTDVYVGGSLKILLANGVPLDAADGIAKWNGSSWEALGSNGAGDGAIKGSVWAIDALGSDLLVGGHFSNVNNNGSVVKEADYVAAYGMTAGGADVTPPSVASITRLDLSPTDAASVRFLVSFSEPVGGLDVTDFQVTAPTLVGAGITSMSDYTGATITVTVSTGSSGSGKLRLDVLDSDSIKDSANNPLGGTGSGNGDFTAGEFYKVRMVKVLSTGTQDGWILESGEDTNQGGTLNAGLDVFNVGDHAANRQYRAILSFDTSAIPDNAVITGARLKIKRQQVVGTNPFTTHGGLKIDMKKPNFGAAAGLDLDDFNALAGKTAVAAFGKQPTNGWYIAILNSAAYSYINRTGKTQFRLRFVIDDDNDLIADYIKFYSGNAAAAYRPILIVEYALP